MRIYVRQITGLRISVNIGARTEKARFFFPSNFFSWLPNYRNKNKFINYTNQMSEAMVYTHNTNWSVF